MKIAVSGKGGVGKTTLVALIARILHDQNYKVTLIDADPDMNLASVLGIPGDTPITPIIAMKDLIEERTGAKVDEPAPFFKMNPKVDDIPDKYSINYNGLKLMVMGTIRNGGGGCACPLNAFLKSLLGYIIVLRDEWVLLDMEAGIEHLGRGTAIGVDQMIVVVEPNKTSIETAYRIEKLSGDLGIKNLSIIANKIQSPEEKKFLKDSLKSFNILGYIGYSDIIKKISFGVINPFEVEISEIASIKELVVYLIKSTHYESMGIKKN